MTIQNIIIIGPGQESPPSPFFRKLSIAVLKTVTFFMTNRDYFRDKLEMKAVKDGSASYAALEKKAELYEKLARGEVSDEEDKEKYCVDFFNKTFVEDESQRHNTFSFETSKQESDTYDEPVLPDTRSTGLGRAAGTVDNDEHKRFVRYFFPLP